MDPNRNVVLKIRNLLKKAEASANNSINERIACAEIAQRLMDQYKISYEVAMAEADEGVRKNAQEPVIDYIKEYQAPFTSIINPPDWVKSLLHTIASHNDCEAYIANCARKMDDGKTQIFSGFSVVGRNTDIAVIHEIFWWLLCEIYRIGAKEGKGKDASWHNDFRIGAVRNLDDRLNALKNDKPKMPGLTTEQVSCALAVINKKKQEVSNFFANSGDRFEEKGESKAKDNIAFGCGYLAADQISLSKNKELDGDKSKLLKG